MFSNFAWSEMLIIACVAIIVVGPKDLPAMLRAFGKTIGSVKRMAGDFQRQFNDAIREAELDDVKDLTSTKGFAPLEDAKKSMQEFAESIQEPVSTETSKKEPTPPAAKTPPAEKPAAKKPAPRKTTAKKTPAKTAPAKTATAKPAAAKTSPAKRAAPKKKAAAAKSTAKTPAKSAS